MTNYLLPIVEAYFAEILPMKGRLWVADTCLTFRKDQLLAENLHDRDLFTSITAYRDLSIKKGNNLFVPNFSYLVTVGSLDQEITDIISEQSCHMAAQAYEIFETFLIDILTEYFYQVPQSRSSEKIPVNEANPTKASIRVDVKKKHGKNNKGLLSMARKLSGHFRQYESENFNGVNMSDWFDLLSAIRHDLIHKRQIMSQRLLDYLQTHQAEKLFAHILKRFPAGINKELL